MKDDLFVVSVSLAVLEMQGQSRDRTYLVSQKCRMFSRKGTISFLAGIRTRIHKNISEWQRMRKETGQSRKGTEILSGQRSEVYVLPPSNMACAESNMCLVTALCEGNIR